jgi:transposase-like protein
VASDGAQGLETALDHYLYGVPHQRCIFHKIKNLADPLVWHAMECDTTEVNNKAQRKAKRIRKAAILADASAVYASDEAADIRARAEGLRAT